MEKLSGKKIVVTGGAGFIGSNLVFKLLDLGADVIVVDDLSTGRLSNIESVLDKINFIEGSITNIETLSKAFDGADYVLHQAAIPSVPRSIENPIPSHDVNINGTFNVFSAAKDAGVKRVLYAGSSSTYGNPKTMPVNEDMLLNPLSPYAVQKATVELYAKVFKQLYGLDVVGLKYFNVFGPNQDPSSEYSAVIPRFIKLVARDNRPTIFGDGSTTRDFTYVDNVVHANIQALLTDKIEHDVINVSTGSPTSLNHLVESINSILGKKILPVYEDFRDGDIKHSHAEITKAKESLGYEPIVHFDEGIELTIKHILEKEF